MTEQEKQWIDEAMEIAKRADQKGVSIVLARYQDLNDEADVVITNVKDPLQLKELVKLRSTNLPMQETRGGDLVVEDDTNKS